jgi:hypothetical protein
MTWPKPTCIKLQRKSKTQNLNQINFQKKLMLRFFSRMYENVNWDSKLPRKLHAPVSTFEPRTDPLRQQFQQYTRPQIWQVNSKS